MATRLAASAAEHTLAAHKDALERPGRPEPAPITLDARPSEILGQSFTNAISPTISKLAEETHSSNHPHPLFNPNLSSNLNAITNRDSGRNFDANFKPNFLPNIDSDFARESLVQLAEAFLGSPKRRKPPANVAYAAKQFEVIGKDTANVDPFPTIRGLAPGADQNFGIPKGEGCLPFLSEFMQIAYGNCVKEADEKTWDLWGGQINNALLGGKVDLLEASKETCKRGAERQQCGQLRKVISECDILGSLQVGMQMQRAIKRCDEISGILDQVTFLKFC
ncbi:unnamed protein product [Toxocara canis]|uniref:PMEI domain-containing protein n=1 Tax=Toxocara canis TaxID=6265 RepID=A0A183VBT9_TOXCA|nr:unnamed protein product [Toxocara canis]